eukprot:6735540-Pyramimonas_sp.AAC.1
MTVLREADVGQGEGEELVSRAPLDNFQQMSAQAVKKWEGLITLFTDFNEAWSKWSAEKLWHKDNEDSEAQAKIANINPFITALKQCLGALPRPEKNRIEQQGDSAVVSLVKLLLQVKAEFHASGGCAEVLRYASLPGPELQAGADVEIQNATKAFSELINDKLSSLALILKERFGQSESIERNENFKVEQLISCWHEDWGWLANGGDGALF